MKRKYLVLLAAACLLGCSTPCELRVQEDGPDYRSMFIYKFPDGEDYSDHVVLNGRWVEGDTAIVAPTTGFSPIPLHGGYYLGGNMLRLNSAYLESIFYLSITYSDIANGTAPADWLDNWKQYLLPRPENGVYNPPYEQLYYRSGCDCEEADCYYQKRDYYNEDCLLGLPIAEDAHTDTNLINRWIDEGTLGEHFHSWY